MIVVSDTTPIIALLKVNRLTVLRDLYGYVIIPEAVLAELSNDAKFNKEAEYVEQSDFIEVQKVSEVDAVNIAQRFKALHQGEIEALEDNNIYISDALYAWLLEDNSVEGR